MKKQVYNNYLGEVEDKLPKSIVVYQFDDETEYRRNNWNKEITPYGAFGMWKVTKKQR